MHRPPLGVVDGGRWVDAEVAMEIGRHGAARDTGLPVSHWKEQFAAWLQQRGILAAD